MMNSWLGGGLSSLKGQLSHLISEGTEEIIDAKDDLMIAKEKLEELEHKLKYTDKENTELKNKNEELNVKLKSEELMIDELTNNFKQKLKEKDEIIQSLTNKLTDIRGEPEGEVNFNSNLYHDNVYKRSSFDFEDDDLEVWKQRVKDLEKELLDLRNQENVDVQTLLQEQRQELEMKHSNYILQLQEEYENQIRNLKRSNSLSEDSAGQDYGNLRQSWTDYSSEWVQTEDKNVDIWKDSNDDVAFLDNYKSELEKNNICQILDVVTKLVKEKEIKLDEILNVLTNYSDNSFSPNQTSSSLFGSKPLDSLSQVSDVSEMSVRSKLLEDKVQKLSKQLADYEIQLDQQINTAVTQTKLNNENASENQPTSPVTNKIQNLKLKLSMRKNVAIDAQDKQISLLSTPEEDELTIEDDHEDEDEEDEIQEEFSYDDNASNKKTNKSLSNRKDLLAHVETFNQERDEEMSKLEAKLVSLQNLVEEKEDEIRELNEREKGLLFEYSESIRVLNSELDNVQEELDASREKNTEYRKRFCAIEKDLKDKDEMIRWLNEEMTMLSTVEDKDDDRELGLIENERIKHLENVLEEKMKYIEELETSTLVGSSTTSTTNTNDEGKCSECDEIEAEYRRSVDEKNEIIKKLHEQYQDYVEKYESIQNKVKELTTKITKFEQINQEKDERIKLLEKDQNEKIKLLEQLKFNKTNDNNDDDNSNELIQKIWDLENQLEEKNELFELIKTKDYEIDTLKQIKFKLEQDLIYFKDKEQELLEKNYNLQINLNDKDNNINDDTNDNDDDDGDLVKKVWELENLLEEKTEMIEKFQDSERMLEEKELEIKELIAEKCQLEEQLKFKIMQQDNNIITNDSGNSEKMLENKIKELENLLSEKNKVIDNLKTIQLEQRVKEDEIRALTNEKSFELNNKINLQATTSYKDENDDEDNLMKRVWELENLIEEKNEMIEGYQNNERILIEKNENITYLMDENHKLEEELMQFRQKIDNNDNIAHLTQLISEKEWEIETLKNKNENLLKKINEIEEKETEITVSTSTTTTSSETVNNDYILSKEEWNKTVEELNWYKDNRDQLIKALNQKHQESVSYHAEAQKLANTLREKMCIEKFDKSVNTNSNEFISNEEWCKMKQELDRLKITEEKMIREKLLFQQHLMKVEESYTEESTRSEEREAQLRQRVRELEDERIAEQELRELEKSGSSDLQRERDEALRELALSQTRLQECKVSLSNLQSALDHFQKEQNGEASFLREKHESELRKVVEERKVLRERCNILEKQIKEQLETVEAAQRLSEHVDKKEDQLARLQAELSKKDEIIDSLRYEVRQLNSVTESKVDKLLMRNLVIGYFHTPEKKKTEALRVIGSLLQFSDDDYQQIGVDIANKSRWFSWLKYPSGGASSGDGSVSSAEADKKTFSELFVAFLERESNPNNSNSSIRLPGTEAYLHNPVQSWHNQSATHSNTRPHQFPGVTDPQKFFTSSPMLHKRAASIQNSDIYNGRSTSHSTSSDLGFNPLTESHKSSPSLGTISLSSYNQNIPTSSTTKNPLLSILTDNNSASSSTHPPSDFSPS